MCCVPQPVTPFCTAAPSAVEAIDVHGHYGDCEQQPPRSSAELCRSCRPCLSLPPVSLGFTRVALWRPGNRLGNPDILNELMSGGPDVIVSRAKLANIRMTCVSPLKGLLQFFRTGSISEEGWGRTAETVAGNAEAFEDVKKTEGLAQWVVVNPYQPRTYQQAEEMLKTGKCCGIKLHPEEHGWKITGPYGQEAYKFAAAQGPKCVIMTHSGEPNSLPEDFVPYADRYEELCTIW